MVGHKLRLDTPHDITLQISSKENGKKREKEKLVRGGGRSTLTLDSNTYLNASTNNLSELIHTCNEHDCPVISNK